MTAEFERFFKGSEQARKEILLTGETSGSIQCPMCGMQLNFQVSPNKHVHAQCIDPKCLRWME